ncbi:hypothetical protein [Sphingobium sp. Cam5-1]|uniref:hypothetical protein n=1 Tax=Sphingobium sp. Cam5-1 TaxID=2789327 RepID=UPI0018AD2B3D|nr:hypothetical protein [Sphingobium sp. Cam5-1]QPI75573.1 hypothetical protein IZV00_19180 [Sphingobium sp. Cam5-1]
MRTARPLDRGLVDARPILAWQLDETDISPVPGKRVARSSPGRPWGTLPFSPQILCMTNYMPGVGRGRINLPDAKAL